MKTSRSEWSASTFRDGEEHAMELDGKLNTKGVGAGDEDV
jgi:hypothetical protein